MIKIQNPSNRRGSGSFSLVLVLYHILNKQRYHFANKVHRAKGEWRTEELGVLQFMGLQRVGRDLVTEQQQQQPILQM